MCRCPERRVALGAAARALLQGDRAKAAGDMRFVGSSLKEDAAKAVKDARQMAASRLSAARQRLAR